ncbi:hypothetical protein C8F04DRAFT_1184308 [Mycena alexandri]|uniref:Uncharacterized protein n=1 Tax=Mycena alexandri TaxID=1745969 RepID=A0AAD6WZI9_9AGAR|nr:hypothetical protein C8F04DRAFT_1184308 [Mycena alexandri]
MQVFSKLWTPRLQAWYKDAEIWAREPIYAAFSMNVANKTKQDIHATLSTGCFQTCGESVNPHNSDLQKLLFLEVLWFRFDNDEKDEDSEDLALKQLLSGQFESFRLYDAPLPQVSLFHDIQEDLLEPELVDQSGDDNPDSGGDDNSDSDSRRTESTSANPKFRQCKKWLKRIQDFFYLDEKAIHSPRQVRAWSIPIVYLTGHEANTQDSGLARTMQEVTCPGNLLETSRSLAFATTIGGITTVPFYKPSLPLKGSPQSPMSWTSNLDPVELLNFISSLPKMHLWRSNLMAVYMFVSEDCFDVNWSEWMAPSLETLQFSSWVAYLKFNLDGGWNTQSMYRTLMGSPIMNDRAHPDLKNLHYRLRGIISLTREHRDWLQHINRETSRPPHPGTTAHVATSSSLPKVAASKNKKRKDKQRQKKTKSTLSMKETVLGLEEDQKCRRTVWVEEQDVKHLRGCVLTCASPGDELRPKAAMVISPWCVHVISYREDVFERCGKDMTKFVVLGTEKCVGGVRFKALSSEILHRLQDNHRLVSIRTVRRRESMEAYAYGTMTAVGTRQATGGWRGDAYAPYAMHHGETIEDFEALFRHCYDTLVTTGCSIYPPLRRQISKSTNDSGLSRLGTLGGTSFYCTNYMSNIHDDEDDGEDKEQEGCSR